ncbi:MAG: hypothetical protein DI536_33905 [Archangium gephyra]|uniref:Abortive phage infection protein C-terminal domain-containing protein n=1 Tax=Archangium gephyra TaxID=48 RepID=A0A2W5SUX2_9BACT|nr:MAG: hypothetical protein DI536_33905 [Archangium gephyra]
MKIQQGAIVSQIHVRQIQNYLKKNFEPHVDMSDVKSTGAELEKHRASRALAAFALTIIADCEPIVSAQRITDGGQDHAIDALYFDEDEQCLFVVQAKWHNEGKGTISQGDTLKVIEGIRKLFESDSDAFGAKLKSVWDVAGEKFHGSTSAKVVLCLVHTGTQPLSVDVQSALASYRKEVNDVSELLTVRVLDQKELHEFITAGAQGKPVDLEILLNDWGKVTAPYDALYGRVLASDVANWLTEHSRDRLFHQNIRKILPDSDINENITKTLSERPEQFWYLNNGVTRGDLGIGGVTT